MGRRRELDRKTTGHRWRDVRVKQNGALGGHVPRHTVSGRGDPRHGHDAHHHLYPILSRTPAATDYPDPNPVITCTPSYPLRPRRPMTLPQIPSSPLPRPILYGLSYLRHRPESPHHLNPVPFLTSS